MLLAIDPGKEKCGLAVLDENKQVLEKTVISTEQLAFEVISLMGKHKLSTILVGNSTHSREVQKKLIGLNLKADIVCIPEKFSTLEARKLYWKKNPPKGLWRLIPTSLRVPPRPLDDYAAIILAQRYLGK